MYGTEFILDLKDCDTEKFTQEELTRYFEELCDLIEMERCDLHFWGYETEEEKNEAPDHLAGLSAVQFIMTSNITIHTLDKVGEIYINVFSCKHFHHGNVRYFSMKFFGGTVMNESIVHRGVSSKCKNM